MRELKSDDQSQPDRGEIEIASFASELKETSADLDRAESPLSALVEAPAPSLTRKRRATTPKTAAKTKQPTSLKAKQPPSTQVKSIWEPTQPSIGAKFQHLEQELRQLKTQADQINQQSIEIQSEMQALRTIAHTAHPQSAAKQPNSSLGQSTELNIPPFLLDRRIAKTNSVTASLDNGPVKQAPADPPIVTPSVPSVHSSETPPRFLTAPRPKTAAPRRRTLRSGWRRLQPWLHLPPTRGAIVADAALWVAAATGLRIGLTLLTKSLPFFNGPIVLLLFVPAVLASYLAFCVPKSSPVLIYRLLLLTLGLLLGGKL